MASAPRALALAALAVLALLAVWAGARAQRKLASQRLTYAMAERRALETGKPLVVIGDPAPPNTLNWWFGRGHGSGQVCIDANGAPSARNSVRVRGSVPGVLRGLPDNCCVLYESEVLLYVPPAELDETLREMQRISGGDLYANHSNVIDALSYARTGVLQPPCRFNLRRMQAHGPSLRAFTAYPPFHPYAWIEFRGKVHDPAEVARHFGG